MNKCAYVCLALTWKWAHEWNESNPLSFIFLLCSHLLKRFIQPNFNSGSELSWEKCFTSYWKPWCLNDISGWTGIQFILVVSDPKKISLWTELRCWWLAAWSNSGFYYSSLRCVSVSIPCWEMDSAFIAPLNVPSEKKLGSREFSFDLLHLTVQYPHQPVCGPD